MAIESSMDLEPIPFDPKSVFSAFQTYADWGFAWWREIFQNSVDAIYMRRVAHYKKNLLHLYKYKGGIHIDYQRGEGDRGVVVSVSDNGIGMSKDMLYRALLSFGGSGKGGTVRGASGGFGKAKELIFIPWQRWEIETAYYDWQDNVVKRTTSHGRHFDRQRMSSAVEEVVPGSENDPLHKSIGTKLTVWMGSEDFDWLNSTTHEAETHNFEHQVPLTSLEPLLERSYVPHVRLTINGERKSLTQGPRMVGTFRGQDQEPVRVRRFQYEDKIGSVNIYVDRKRRPYEDIIVRQNGLFMFSAGRQPNGVKGSVRIECTGSAIALYTDNRDRLKSSFCIDEIIQKLATDGVYGLRKDRGAVTLSSTGSDISEIEDERIQELVGRKAESLRKKAPVIEANISLKVEEEDGTDQHSETLVEAEERRKELEKHAAQTIIEEFESETEHEIRSWGRTDADSIRQTLSTMPVRLTAEEFIHNNYWAPKQVIHSELGCEIIKPKYWLHKGEKPDKYTWMLMDIWTNMVRLCAVTIGVDLSGYSTGFVFSWDENGEYTLGLHIEDTDHGSAILINPTKIEPKKDEWGEIKYRHGQISSFKQLQRWRFGNRAHLESLLSIAVHEVTHAQGYCEHNDKFADALTRNMAAIMPRGSRLLSTLVAGARKRWKAIQT